MTMNWVESAATVAPVTDQVAVPVVSGYVLVSTPAWPVAGEKVQLTWLMPPVSDAVPETFRVESAEAGTKRLAGLVI